MTEPRSTARRIRVLWNPASGRKGGVPTNRASSESLRELMARHDLGDELIETASEDHAIERARDAVARGYDIVVAAGGDGSIGSVGEQLIGSQTALGVLPLGSVMNIPRMLEIPRDLDEAAAIIRQGDVRTIDVAEADGAVFFEVASVGLHAAMFREMPKVDEGDYGAIIRSILAAFRYRPSRMTLELDGDRTVETRALLVAVANGPYMGAGFTVAPEASIDDGSLDVRLFLHYSKRELVRHFVSIAFGRRAYAPHVQTERARRVRITSARPLAARADAQDLGTTPVTFEIRPSALRVIAPRPAGSGP
jgi:diacylglycerol kinase (ATP)